VLLVGYDSNTNFIFKNSLGDDWGDKGYGTFKKYYDCGIRIVSYEFYGFRMSLFVVLALLMVVLQGM
jgi:C1A family cysteine protease